MVSRLRFNKHFECHVAAVAPARITRPQTLGRYADRRDQRFAQNAAAHVCRARVALRKLMAGEIARGARQIVIIKPREIFSEQRRLLEFLRSSGYSLSRAGKLLERVSGRGHALVFSASIPGIATGHLGREI